MINGQEGETTHALDLNLQQNTHNKPIYSIDSGSTLQSELQNRVSQQIDVKSIVLLIVNKAIIIFLYFILEGFPLLDFIFVLTFVSVDFWMCKNIYGKKLVGLRWWIELDQVTEQEEWVFQSADPKIEINKVNYAVFWISNFVVLLFWIVNCLLVLIISDQLFWVGLSMFCLLLSLINMGCFYRCRGLHQKKLSQIMEKVGLGSAANMISASDQTGRHNQQANFQIQ